MAELRKINFDERHFECCGKKYYVQDSLSFNRYKELQRLSIELLFGADYFQIFTNLSEIEKSLNALKWTEAAVIVHNTKMLIKNLKEKEDPALMICTLFINEEGEDLTVFNEDKMREKISCWGAELDVSPFFQFASSQVPNWIDAYNTISRDGSEKKSKKESSH